MVMLIFGLIPGKALEIPCSCTSSDCSNNSNNCVKDVHLWTFYFAECSCLSFQNPFRTMFLCSQWRPVTVFVSRWQPSFPKNIKFKWHIWLESGKVIIKCLIKSSLIQTGLETSYNAQIKLYNHLYFIDTMLNMSNMANISWRWMSFQQNPKICWQSKLSCHKLSGPLDISLHQTADKSL